MHPPPPPHSTPWEAGLFSGPMFRTLVFAGILAAGAGLLPGPVRAQARADALPALVAQQGALDWSFQISLDQTGGKHSQTAHCWAGCQGARHSYPLPFAGKGGKLVDRYTCPDIKFVAENLPVNHLN